jgi:AbrB family transcriptional regulator (stage V sporulation protein T)
MPLCDEVIRMKGIGIVRRVDDLGRVVIPKEIRRKLRIREGDLLELFIDREGYACFRKYSPIGQIGDFAKEYADLLYEETGHIALITDRDLVVQVSGAPKREYLDKPVEEYKIISQCLEDRKVRMGSNMVVAPVISDGDVVGSVALLAQKDYNGKIGDVEYKIVAQAANFLGKQCHIMIKQLLKK